MSRLILAATFCALAGCTWRVQTPPNPVNETPPVSAPPAAQLPPSRMTYEEAVHRGSRYAESRGFAYRLKKAKLDSRRVWKVSFDVRRYQARGELRLEYDAYSRALLTAEEKIGRHRDRGNDDDDDDDDDDDHRRRGKHRNGDD